MGRFLPSIIGAYLLACGMTSHAHAQLKPDQVVIIGMAGSEASGELARYYAKARGIPESHILLLDGKLEQRITRFRWEQTIRPAVRTWLYRQEFLPNIRCIVTVWDVPLTIAPTERSSAEFTERIGYLRRTRGALVAQACQMFDLLHSLGRPAGSATTVPPAAADISLKDLNSRFVEAMKVATERLRNASTAEDRDSASKFLERILVTVSGDHGLLQIALPRSAAAATAQTTEQKTNASYLTGRLQGLQRGIQSLDALRETVARDEQSLQLTQTMGGLFGAIRWLDQQLYLMEKNLSGASFDSELSLVLWPDPPVLSWLPNPWHYRFDMTPAQRRTTLFVSRLAGPTPEISRRLIDDAIAAEATSLQGVVYLDAQGRPYDPNLPDDGSFGEYDQSLRDLDERLRKHTSLKVVLDNRPDLFQPGQCPQAALYCGWHSPGKYTAVFEWSTGAVGYHLSSSEADWLQLNDDGRLLGKTPWCPSMLADGACATLGSCQEAYLVAFPLPDDFFSLLLTGKYTLAEAYYRTCPFLSWNMLVIGDPLYNPYAKSPQLPETAMPDRLKPGASAKEVARSAMAHPATQPTNIPAPVEQQPAKPGESTRPEVVLPGLEP